MQKIQSSQGFKPIVIITQTYIFWALYFIPPRLNVKKIWLIVKFYSDRKGKKLREKYKVLLVTEHSVREKKTWRKI